MFGRYSCLVEIYLPIHQTTADEVVFDGIDALLFDNQRIIMYVEHLYYTGRADISFRNPCIETVATEIVKSVHIELTAYELMEKLLRIFVLENLYGKIQTSAELLIHALHEKQRNLFMVDTCYKRILQDVGKRAMPYIMKKNGGTYSLSLAFKDEIAFFQKSLNGQ